MDNLSIVGNNKNLPSMMPLYSRTNSKMVTGIDRNATPRPIPQNPWIVGDCSIACNIETTLINNFIDSVIKTVRIISRFSRIVIFIMLQASRA